MIFSVFQIVEIIHHDTPSDRNNTEIKDIYLRFFNNRNKRILYYFT